MELSHALQEKITKFIVSIPNIDQKTGRRALLSQAGFDSKLQEQLMIEGETFSFVQVLLETLIRYGALEDNRIALVALLEATRERVGKDRSLYCDKLIEEFLESQDFLHSSSDQQKLELISCFTWSDVRAIVESAMKYIVGQQKPNGTWRRGGLYRTARTLFGLLISGTDIPTEIIQNSTSWLQENLLITNEAPGSIALAILALKEAEKFGIKSEYNNGIEFILKNQNRDGSWNGRDDYSRHFASSTAHCVQALRSQMIDIPSNIEYEEACDKGVQFLKRYFRNLATKLKQANYISSSVDYSDIVNPIEALMLPHYEAWGIIDAISDIADAIKYFKDKRNKFIESKTNKAIAGIISLLTTEWKNFDSLMMSELLSALIKFRNVDCGWHEQFGESSQAHHTAMIAIPIRQLERLRSGYIPVDINDKWSLPRITKNMRTEHSVGAVILRFWLDEAELLLLKRENGTWVLPKGHPQKNETEIEALKREVKEETGIKELEIIKELGNFRYLFRPADTWIDKTVTYYLAKPVDDIPPLLETDSAHIDIEWISITEINRLPLYYDDARRVIDLALLELKTKESTF